MARPTIYPQLYGTIPGGDSDEKVGVSSNDAAPGYLNGKLVAGTDISLTEMNDGADETLIISSTFVQEPSATVSATPPLLPESGDMWWNPSTNTLSVFTTEWVIVSGEEITFSDTPPLDAESGDLWWSPTAQVLSIFDVTWVEVSSSGGGGSASISISDTPPPTPVAGDMWWDSSSGNLFVYYDDGSSTQWVIAVQVTDGVDIEPVENAAVYTSGAQSFVLTGMPYKSYVGVYVNGLRLSSVQWVLFEDQVTIIPTLSPGDEVTFDFFIVGDGVMVVDPYPLSKTDLHDFDMDTDGTRPRSFGYGVMPHIVHQWTPLNEFEIVEKDI